MISHLTLLKIFSFQLANTHQMRRRSGNEHEEITQEQVPSDRYDFHRSSNISQTNITM